MRQTLRTYWPVAVLAAWLVFIVALTIQPYAWSPSALFHLDETLAEPHPVPEGFVILQMPGYDGAQYYQIARNMPLVFNPSRWTELSASAPLSYAYQRFLLPFTAFLVSFGQESFLPYAFLGINILSLLAACALLLKANIKPLYAVALGFSPAAAVAMHFSLAEPLTILLVTAFLIRYVKKESIGWVEVLLLSLAVVTREVNIFLVCLLLVWSLWKGRWRDAALLLFPILSFAALHALIHGIFHEFPFLTSAAKRDLTGGAIWKLLTGGRGYNMYSLSAIALFLGFVLPSSLYVVADIVRKRRIEFLPLAALAFLGLMWTMPDEIWGAITSIGRVITPAYPLVLLFLARKETWIARGIAVTILLVGAATSVGLAIKMHPFLLA